MALDHEVLIDKKDYIKSVKESDINDDDHHNVSESAADNDDADLDEYDKEKEESKSYYDIGTNSYV